MPLARRSSASGGNDDALHLASAALSNPIQILRKSFLDLKANALRNLVRMKRPQFFLNCCLSIFAHFKKNDSLAADLDYLVPGTDRLHDGQYLRAGNGPVCA